MRIRAGCFAMRGGEDRIVRDQCINRLIWTRLSLVFPGFTLRKIYLAFHKCHGLWLHHPIVTALIIRVLRRFHFHQDKNKENLNGRHTSTATWSKRVQYQVQVLILFRTKRWLVVLWRVSLSDICSLNTNINKVIPLTWVSTRKLNTSWFYSFADW